MKQGKEIFKGVLTALVTPFKEDKIDIDALKVLILRQIEAGVKGLVISGSTGEGNLLSSEEFNSLIKQAASIRDHYDNEKNSKIIGSISGLKTAEILSSMDQIKGSVDAYMITAPYYVKPSQQGIFEFFKEIDEGSNLPIMAYCHPGRTGVDFSAELINKLSVLPNIAAIKDASGDLKRVFDIRQENKINMLGGNDDDILAFAANGGSGIVSVISNIFPLEVKKIMDLIEHEQYSEARDILYSIKPVLDFLSTEVNPVAIKYILSIAGYCTSDVRRPLCPMSSDSTKRACKIMNEFSSSLNFSDVRVI